MSERLNQSALNAANEENIRWWDKKSSSEHTEIIISTYLRESKVQQQLDSMAAALESIIKAEGIILTVSPPIAQTTYIAKQALKAYQQGKGE